MRFPLMSRADHNEHLRLMNVVISSLEQTIRDKDIVITEKNLEILSLMEQLTAQTPASRRTREPKEPKPKTVAITGRSGWRARAEQTSRETIPPPRDSAQALEQKVIREGGTV